MHLSLKIKDILGEYKAKMCAANFAPAIRQQIESKLSPRIASALTPTSRIIRPVAATGIEQLDTALHGGLPVGAISEFVGPECSGRTAVALSFLAQSTQAGKFCAWIDVSNALDPLSAAATGVNLERLLWVRCGATDSAPAKQYSFALQNKCFAAPPIKRGLHGGGFGAHPRNEVKELSNAIEDLLTSKSKASQQAKPQCGVQPDQPICERNSPNSLHQQPRTSAAKSWSRIEQALRVTDLLSQGGGFSVIVLDMGSLAPEIASRIPLATWFRYRAVAERTQSSIIILTQYRCAKSSAELLLQFQQAEPLSDEATVFTGFRPSIELVRRRFAQDGTDILPLRKSPQSTTTATWDSRPIWAVCR
jgi:recombination protein RecA